MVFNKQLFQLKLHGWLVHCFSASASIIGLYALWAIALGQFKLAFWLIGAAILIDSVDGTLARKAQVSVHIHHIDGLLLDNIIDYLNYVIVPAFLLLMHPNLLIGYNKWLMPGIIVFVSAFQFVRRDAKTEDKFFKGFPSYWNIVAFYIFIMDLSPTYNALIIFILAILTLVPFKYIYISRMANVTNSNLVTAAIWLLTIGFLIISLVLLWQYPKIDNFLLGYGVFYLIAYVLFSIYRTFIPLKK
jgi:phosphatidylcholine synthase